MRSYVIKRFDALSFHLFAHDLDASQFIVVGDTRFEMANAELSAFHSVTFPFLLIILIKLKEAIVPSYLLIGSEIMF